MTNVRESLTYEPHELTFGTSGLRGLLKDMTDIECYINAVGFLKFIDSNSIESENKIVYIAGDLRSSTPRIICSLVKAAYDSNYTPIYCGFIPTPALAHYGLSMASPVLMVTGSHIPDDRNGIKFYKRDGELLKKDEKSMQSHVADIRQDVYASAIETSDFTITGELKERPEMLPIDTSATNQYASRHIDFFGTSALSGKKIIFYQHSAVGRDSLVDLLRKLGAEVIPVGRSEKFISIDTENVTKQDEKYFTSLATEHPDAFAIVSTDGDSDRPFLIDETGQFHRGDVLGTVVSDWLYSGFAAFPVSSSDALDMFLELKHKDYEHTKIGSPYVIAAMNSAKSSGHTNIVGWEVNGGFLLGSKIIRESKELSALPTRDAILPIIIGLVSAIEKNIKISELFKTLPQRSTQAGLIDNFPIDVSKKIIQTFTANQVEATALLSSYFTVEDGFDNVSSINSLDGLRIYFKNGDIAHLRPSGNAPQLRIYSVSDTQDRADEIVHIATKENGIFRKLESDFSAQE